ncbi:hypothetical protein KIV65_gp09 [Mycobacterium phage Anthony]|uniref:Uncharacterized protein n=1 Tax=Mycobacterium phage Anthony TaxID=2599857 RepID=A0A5J6TJ98_9CAUD|nr:hypothetical protein KIV65_gp09 [Mycobacterium phage Anthony]QFG10458.1 hypothetical protein PBI_ANTHONY_88 [Mycobacterium phage Anthony]
MRQGMYTNETMSFEAWLARIDRSMIRQVGVGYRDIGDWAWRDAYDNGVTTLEAAREALREEGLYV